MRKIQYHIIPDQVHQVFIWCFILFGNLMYLNAQPPNIVWIIIEDMSPDLSSYEHEIVITPVIDGLAEKGIRYTNAFATGVACSPSRTALVTGYYQNHIGAFHMRYPEELKPDLPENIQPIHVHLKEAGFQTANIRSFPGNGKTDWLFKFDPDSYDYKNWDEINPQKPFFARINIRLTHRPFEHDEHRPINSDDVIVPPYYPDHPVSRADFAHYYESIQVMDSQVGTILNDLKKRGLDKNTMIFLFSDHGRPMPRAKNYLYDSGIQVPLLISSLDERIRRDFQLHGENNSLFSLIDVTAATMEVTGQKDIPTQGISMLSVPDGREFVWAAADRIGEIHFQSRMIRDHHFKYIRNDIRDLSINDASTAYRKSVYPIHHLLNVLNEQDRLSPEQKKLVEPMEKEELYDVSVDSYEMNNLVQNPEYYHILLSMRQQLAEYTQQIQDQGLSEDSPDIVAAFENYGRSSMEKHKNRILELKRKVEEITNE